MGAYRDERLLREMDANTSGYMEGIRTERYQVALALGVDPNVVEQISFIDLDKRREALTLIVQAAQVKIEKIDNGEVSEEAL